MQKTLLHPFGLTLFLASLVLAGLMFFVLDRWSGQALWMIILGFLAYAASTAVLHRWPTDVRAASIVSDDTSLDAQEDQEDELLGLEEAEEDIKANVEIGVEAATPDFRSSVHEALRRFKNPARLAQSPLGSLLPATLAAYPSQDKSLPTPGGLAPLDRVQVLREVLIAAIERLRSTGEATGSRSSQEYHYFILYEQYVLGRSVANVAVRHGIPEGTYFKWQGEAVTVVARQLQSQEEQNGR